MKIILRSPEPNDSAAITILSEQLGYAASESETRAGLKSIKENHDNCAMVAVENGQIVGWIHGFYTVRIEAVAFVEIAGLVIDENHRKKGIGKLLIEKIYDWARTKKCTKIVVRSNETRKETAIFYEKLGFKLNKVQRVVTLEI